MTSPIYEQQPQQLLLLPTAWNFNEPIFLGFLFTVFLYIALNHTRTSSKLFQGILARYRKRNYSGANNAENNELQRFSSSSSSDSSQISETSSDTEYDDVLASVSLLFREENEQEEQDISYYQRHDSGTIIARILPKGDIEYEKTKPIGHRCADASLFRRLIQEDLFEAATSFTKGQSKDLYIRGDFSDQNELMVSLEVDINLTTLPNCKTKGMECECSDGQHNGEDKNHKLVARQHHLHMQMHRVAEESANRTLKRLQLSAARKIRSQIQAVDQSLRIDSKKRARQPKVFIPPSEHKLANKNFNEAPSLEPSVWVIENSSSFGSDKGEVENEEVLVGKSHERQWHRSSSKRKLDLSHSTIAGTEWQKSSKLWQDLVGFDRSHLYLDLRENGPLLALEVDACPPTIISIVSYEEFRSRVYVGVPLVVEAKLLHATNAMVAWFVSDKGGHQVCRVVFNISSCSPARSSYTPTTDDIGKTVSILIAPMRPGHYGEGFEEAYKFHYPIEERPSLPMVFPIRESWTCTRTGEGNSLRVMSYNLLADWYAGRSAAGETAFGWTDSNSSFYSHCNGEFLRKDRRFPLLVYEMLSYHPDLVCLQEVDSSVYDSLLRPTFEAHGYQGYYSNKASVQVEGCAMFWSLQCFDKAGISDMHQFHLRDMLLQNGVPETSKSDANDESDATISWAPTMETIDKLLRSNPELRRVVTSKVGQVAQIAKLKLRRDSQDQSKPQFLVVGNTHLFYHPMADHIRLIQATQMCRKLDIIRRQCPKTGALNADMTCPIVLCGDLNSHPLSGAVQLLLQGRIGPDHFETWRNLNEYTWEMGDEDFLLEHGYIRSYLDEDNDPSFVNEAFEDAREDIFEDPAHEVALDCADSSQVDAMKTIVFPKAFPKLISGYPQMPEFTNYSVGFAETLDYIFVSEACPAGEKYGLEPQAAAPLPTTGEMQKYGAMPNEFMPSDHLSIVCDLTWKCN